MRRIAAPCARAQGAVAVRLFLPALKRLFASFVCGCAFGQGARPCWCGLRKGDGAIAARVMPLAHVLFVTGTARHRLPDIRHLRPAPSSCLTASGLKAQHAAAARAGAAVLALQQHESNLLCNLIPPPWMRQVTGRVLCGARACTTPLVHTNARPTNTPCSQTKQQRDRPSRMQDNHCAKNMALAAAAASAAASPRRPCEGAI